MPGFGHNSYLGFGEETTWGTAVAATNYLWIDKGGDNANQTQNWIDTSAVGLLGTATELSFAGTRDASGDFGFEMPYQGVERIVKHALGQAWFESPYLSPDTAVKRFTFDVNDDLTEMRHGATLSGKKGLTLRMTRDFLIPNSTFVYNGSKIDSIEWSMQPNQNLRCKIAFVGKGFDNPAGGQGTFAAINFGFFNYYQGVLTYTSTAAGTVIVPLESWSLTFKNNLDRDRYLFSGQDRREPVRKAKIECTQRFTAEFNNIVVPNQSTLAMFEDMKNGKPCQMDMTFLGPFISPNKKFKLSFLSATQAGQLQARVRQFPVKVADEGRIKVDVEIKHYRDAAETPPVIPGDSRRELRVVMENLAAGTDI